MSECNNSDLSKWSYRAAAYELVSLCLLFPGREVADALVTGEFADTCYELTHAMGFVDPAVRKGIEGLSVYEGKSSDDVLHEVRREHTRLFVGMVEPPITPYVGVWDALSRGVAPVLAVGRESMAIERFMRRCGVAKDLDAGQVNEPMDHVGTVCEFLEYLCLVNARAIVPAAMAELHEGDYEMFLSDHFRGYAQWLHRKVEGLSDSALYLSVTKLLALLVID